MSLLGAAGLALLMGVAILLIGLPIALVVHADFDLLRAIFLPAPILRGSFRPYTVGCGGCQRPGPDPTQTLPISRPTGDFHSLLAQSSDVCYPHDRSRVAPACPFVVKDGGEIVVIQDSLESRHG